MINEVDEALRTLVKTDVVNGTDVEVLFDAPTRDWASRRNTPTIDLYLYDLREDTKRRSAGMFEHRNEQGLVTERKALPRYFKLAYLITAWTQRPEDEHRLLSAILACFMRYEVLPPFALTPLLAEVGFPLAVQIAYPPPEDRQVSDVWSSVGGDLKPSVDLVITMPIQPEQFYDVAQAVMAPMRLRSVGHTTMEMEDDDRQLGDHQIGHRGPNGATATAPDSGGDAAQAAAGAGDETSARPTVGAKPRPRKSPPRSEP
ncbi:MAG: DUF4255 domain-containing protein [Actinomycetota bacterium]|nr:DUF4255 domain-containing protein [Actinomycetota bacterium]